MAVTLDGNGHGVSALAAAARGLPWVLRERRVVPADVERGLRLLEGHDAEGAAERARRRRRTP